VESGSRTDFVTFLFTDVEGSTRLWEQEPERMRAALAQHDALGRAAVESHRGVLVKTTGDGMHAAFEDPLDGIEASLDLQLALAKLEATTGLPLRVRCGLHAGAIERRDNDFFGSAVNRAARIMGIGHGGQTLVSQAVLDLVGDRLPAQVSLRDLGKVRLRDLSGSERVFQLVHPSLRSDFPALRSLESTPNNLPQQLTTFVGRERELVEVRKLLRSTRLLTLCGTGGLGKTRLALQVAADALADYADGVWFVDLAPIADARLVPQMVASTMGVKEEAGQGTVEALLLFARDQALLLILDNCEHLVGACAQLATRLLQGGAKLKLLATSREGLRVQGEVTYAVPALAVPSAGQGVGIASSTQYAAVQLFADRAKAVQPTFQLTDRNAAAVADICRRLDGIPLAIELAAARLRALSIDTIASRLGNAFRLLAGGARTALPRQQTLRAMIDWSHDLLAGREQALFRRLSAFAGGWTIDAAEAVCADGDVAREDVLDLLTSLVDKSLVVLDGETGRYRLLDTVRQYADEKLRASADESGTRRRHLDFFLAFAEAVRPQLAGASGADVLRRLDRDLENILAAHHACARPDVPVALGYRLVHAVKPYWFSRGLGLGYGLSVEAVGRGGSEPATAARAIAFFDAGQIAAYMGRYDEAQRHLGESLAMARRLGDESLAPDILQFLALAELGRGDRASARQHCREALDLARKHGRTLEIAGACNALAQLHRMEGDLDEAEPLFEEALALGRAEGNTEYMAAALLNLAMVAIERGSGDRAGSLLLEVMKIAEASGSRHLGVSALEVSVGLAALDGQWERAARLHGVAEAQARDLGIQRDPADEAFLQQFVTKTRASLREGECRDAEDGGRALAYEQAIGEAGAWLLARR